MCSHSRQYEWKSYVCGDSGAYYLECNIGALQEENNGKVVVVKTKDKRKKTKNVKWNPFSSESAKELTQRCTEKHRDTQRIIKLRATP